MRAALLLAMAAACTPEITSGTYLCGPNASCPGDQKCNGPDNVCVVAAADPFACEPEVMTEPDDLPEQAFMFGELGCVSVASVLDNCLLEGDTGDWSKFRAPAICTAVAVDARVTFPTAFAELALELWDLDSNELVAMSKTCPFKGEAGDELRCLDATLVPGTMYGIHVLPSGEGTCDGRCAYNRYTLRMQLNAPR